MVDTAEIAGLPIEERLKLVDFIWDTIVNDPVGPPLSEAQKRELDARLAEAERNPDGKMSWEDFRRSIQK